MNQENREALVDVIEQWKAGKGLIVEEMLKTALRPFIDNEVSRYAGSGVRREDIERAAWETISEALRGYDRSERDIINYIAKRLRGMDEKIEKLRADSAALRGASPAGAKA